MVSIGLIAIVAVVCAAFLIGGTALFAYIALRGKPLPPRGFDVLPEPPAPTPASKPPLRIP